MTSLAQSFGAGLTRHRYAKTGSSAVSAWLFAVAAFVFAMVIVGGATRLTGSGLSITEWRPILGTLPPASQADWQKAFEKYRQIPEYRLVNNGMSLDAFKTLYWWEWGHRLLGRLVGFVFFVPFAAFLIRGSVPRPFIPRVAALFVLGGAQGALGWFMVKSGLTERVDVSQYRLAAHLGLAVLIAGYAFWLALSLRNPGMSRQVLNLADDVPLDGRVKPSHDEGRAGFPALRLGAALLAGLVYLQIIAGGFVAGLKAGHASNTWPLMNGELIPPGLDALSPWYLNLFENPLTAQFAHRAMAYAVALLAVCFGILIWRSSEGNRLRLPAAALGLAIGLQIALGVVTILYGVPIDIALAHQANAIVVFALALWTLHRALYSGPEITRYPS